MARFALVVLASLAAAASGARLNFNVLAQLKRDLATSAEATERDLAAAAPQEAATRSEATEDIATDTLGERVAPTSLAASGNATLQKQWLVLPADSTVGEDVGRLRKAAKTLEVVAANAHGGAHVSAGKHNSTIATSWEARVADTSAEVSRDAGDDDDDDDDTSQDPTPLQEDVPTSSPRSVHDPVPPLEPPPDWRPTENSDLPAPVPAHAVASVPPDAWTARASEAARQATEAQAKSERLASEVAHAAEAAELARARAEAAEAKTKAEATIPRAATVAALIRASRGAGDATYEPKPSSFSQVAAHPAHSLAQGTMGPGAPEPKGARAARARAASASPEVLRSGPPGPVSFAEARDEQDGDEEADDEEAGVSPDAGPGPLAPFGQAARDDEEDGDSSETDADATAPDEYDSEPGFDPSISETADAHGFDSSTSETAEPAPNGPDFDPSITEVDPNQPTEETEVYDSTY